MRGRRIALLLMVGVAIAAPPARGATVELERSCADAECAGLFVDLAFSASPGEANRVSYMHQQGRWRFSDDGAPLTAGSGCRQIDEHTADCGEASAASVDVGDGDDEVIGSGALVLGGEGNDRLVGVAVADAGPGDDLVEGTATRDELRGGPGRDEVRGLGGDDVLSDRGTGGEADIFDGGPGVDLVQYERSGPFDIDLSRASPNGAPGEGDVFASIEGVSVSSKLGDPVGLAGTDGPDVLGASLGPAQIVARAGDDDISAQGPLGDTVDAGPGNDQIELSGSVYPNAERDAISCGPGLDTVKEPGSTTEVAGDCERVRYGSSGRPLFRLRHDLPALDAVFARVAGSRCGATVHRRPRCRAVLRMRSVDASGRPLRGPVLASRVVNVRGGARLPVLSLRLSARGRRILRRQGEVLGRIELRGPQIVPNGFVVRLRPAG